MEIHPISFAHYLAIPLFCAGSLFIGFVAGMWVVFRLKSMTRKTPLLPPPQEHQPKAFCRSPQPKFTTHTGKPRFKTDTRKL